MEEEKFINSYSGAKAALVLPVLKWVGVTETLCKENLISQREGWRTAGPNSHVSNGETATKKEYWKLLFLLAHL